MQGILIILGVILYFWFAQLITWRLMSIPESPGKQRIVCGLCILIAFAIPFGDVVLIKWKFNQLCKSEAGIHVYEQVALGPEFWEEDGTLKSQQLNNGIPKGFEMKNKFERDFSRTLGIIRYRRQLKRSTEEKILGERIIFIHHGGWLQRFIWGQLGGKSCPEYKEILFSGFLSKIFKQQSK